MGRFAADVGEYLRDALADARPAYDWVTEHRIAGTPVDVVGERGDPGDGGHLVCVELEWRRADPADNTAKLFRHLSEGSIEHSRVTVCQAFTAYYALASGGVSSKRENAEFVGRVAARSLDAFEYHAVDFPLDPPKRGADRPDGWTDAADGAVAAVLAVTD